jgi:raffinose/stachyose/melibiose transport system substrate-binding protein
MSRKAKFTMLFIIAFVLITPIFVMAADKVVTVHWWNIGTPANDKAMNQKFVDDFEKSHPGIKIEQTVLENESFKSKSTTVMQSGNPPDLFQTWGGGVLAEYAKAGLLRDISKYVKGTAWGNSMSPAVWDVYSNNGKVYAAATDMGCITFWYNKDLLSKVGYKSFPTDWDDFIALVKKLKAAGITPIAIAGGDKWPCMYYWSFLALRLGGGQIYQDTFSGKNTQGFSNPTFVKAGQMLADLVALKPFQDGFLGATYNDQAALMGNGQAAMELMGQWAPNVERDNSTSKNGIGDKLGCASFPTIKGGKGKLTDVMGGGGGYAVGKNAPDAAIEFLKYLTSVESEIIMTKTNGIIVTVKGAEVGITDPNAKIVKSFVDKSTFFQLYVDQFTAPAVGGTVNDQVQAMLAGTKPADACAAIQDAFQASK